MRVLYLHQYFVPPDGSGGTRSYEMARRMVTAGHDVHMVTSSAFFPAHYEFSRRIERITIDGIRLSIINVRYANAMGYARRVVAFAAFAAGASYVARRADRPDVVFATSTPLTIAIPAVAAKRRHRCPMVFEVRDLWPAVPIAIGALRSPVLKRMALRLERWAYDHADRIVALSPGMKTGVVRTGYAADRVAVVPNVADLDRFRVGPGAADAFLDRHAHLRGGPVVTYAGTLGRINGVDYLVRIAARMRSLDPRVRFLIVGDGSERDAVEALARRRGVLGENLWMIPPVSKREMPAVLAATRVAVSLTVDLPATWHNSANKFFDALASGTPVMINYRGWQADLLEEHGGGIVVPAANVEAACEALHGFLSDDDRVRTAARAATGLAETRFDVDRLAETLVETLDLARADAARTGLGRRMTARR